MARIDGHRRQHGENFAPENISQGAQLRLFEVFGAAQHNPFRLQRRQDFLGQTFILHGDQLANDLTDPSQLFLRCHAVRPGAPGDTRLHFLLQTAHPDHEKLIQVGAEDGQELDALQERHVSILSLFQNPPIELQPAQLAVDIKRRIVQGWWDSPIDLRQGQYGRIRRHTFISRHGSRRHDAPLLLLIISSAASG